MDWDPGQYLRFADHRLRPGVELMARVPLEAPATIVDLGCGTGELTRMLASRWPDARVTGLDSSADMLAKARAADAGAGHADGPLTWLKGTVEDWVSALDDGPPVDLVYSNATLHWVADHRTLFGRLVERLAPGGCLAVQMPLS